MKHQQELMQEVRTWGNSGGILAPKDWMGKQVKVILIDRTEEIKKEVFEILEQYLEDIQGIYLVGSHARGEHEKESDIDILVITEKTRKTITSGKYSVEMYTLQGIKNTLKNHPIMIYPRLQEAKPLMNSQLLAELLQSTYPTKKSFKEFFEECKRIIKISQEFIELDKLDGEELESKEGVIYSLILRLRGMYLIKMILEKKKATKQGFKKWLSIEIKEDKETIEKIYKTYGEARDDKKLTEKISIHLGQKLVNLLKKEVKKYAQSKKAS